MRATVTIPHVEGIILVLIGKIQIFFFTFNIHMEHDCKGVLLGEIIHAQIWAKARLHLSQPLAPLPSIAHPFSRVEEQHWLIN